jgi:hypothetical protein
MAGTLPVGLSQLSPEAAAGRVRAWERGAQMNRDAETRARIEDHWAASERGDTDTEHEIYAADAILDYPQSGERFRGRAKIQAQRGGHPADRHFTVRRISGQENLWISECVITYDGEPTHSVSIMEFARGFVAHETQYFADPFPAAPWRASLAEPIPGDPV